MEEDNSPSSSALSHYQSTNSPSIHLPHCAIEGGRRLLPVALIPPTVSCVAQLVCECFPPSKYTERKSSTPFLPSDLQANTPNDEFQYKLTNTLATNKTPSHLLLQGHTNTVHGQ